VSSSPVGVLLVNLGTPRAPTTEEVRRYLAEFLADPRVVDLPAPLRWALLRFVILPRRAPRSAEAYRQIWTPEGSPLLVHGLALTAAVQTELGADFRVALGMRYGQPSLAAALDELAACERLVVLPLYPQRAESTTGSTLAELRRLLTGRPAVDLRIVPRFFDREEFLEPQAELARRAFAGHDLEHVLFSFHGLPARHVRREDPTRKHCLASPTCCDRHGGEVRECYRAQCFATAHALAAKLGLPQSGYSVAFQSRLGRTEWIGPHTEVRLRELGQSGIRRLGVLCPAFVADCLETLEEIDLRGRETFPGEILRAPCVNADPAWARGVASLVRQAAV
jgi:ferrochelatase